MCSYVPFFVQQGRQRVHENRLDSLLLKHVKFGAFLNAIVRELLLQMQDLVADHDLHFVRGQVRHLLPVTIRIETHRDLLLEGKKPVARLHFQIVHVIEVLGSNMHPIL